MGPVVLQPSAFVVDQTERPFGKNEKKPIQPKTNERVLRRLVRVTNVRNGRFVRFRRVHVEKKILQVPLFRQRSRFHGRPLGRFSHRGVQVHRQKRDERWFNHKRVIYHNNNSRFSLFSSSSSSSLGCISSAALSHSSSSSFLFFENDDT